MTVYKGTDGKFGDVPFQSIENRAADKPGDFLGRLTYAEIDRATAKDGVVDVIFQFENGGVRLRLRGEMKKAEVIYRLRELADALEKTKE